MRDGGENWKGAPSPIQIRNCAVPLHDSCDAATVAAAVISRCLVAKDAAWRLLGSYYNTNGNVASDQYRI